MANSRANPATWLFGEIFTETQANQIDEGQARAVDGRAGQLQIETHSVTRMAEDQPLWRPTLDAHLFLQSPWVASTSSTAAAQFWWPLKVPNGAIITGWSLSVQGNAHADIPANKPTVRLVTSVGGGSFVADASMFASDYNLEHAVLQTGLNFTIDNSTGNVCYLEITAESGANSKPGTRFSKASVTFLVSKLDEG